MKTEIFLERDMTLIAQYDELVSLEIGTLVRYKKRNYVVNGKVLHIDVKLIAYMIEPI
jgi:hypothetical protein